MEAERVIRILTALADGLDPHSGEAFSAASPYQHPDTVRALYAAVRALDPSRTKSTPADRAPQKSVGKAGIRWSPEEDTMLAQEFDAGTPIPELAKTHQRTRGAIEARLVKLGKLDISQAHLPPAMTERIAPLAAKSV